MKSLVVIMTLGALGAVNSRPSKSPESILKSLNEDFTAVDQTAIPKSINIKSSPKNIFNSKGDSENDNRKTKQTIADKSLLTHMPTRLILPEFKKLDEGIDNLNTDDDYLIDRAYVLITGFKTNPNVQIENTIDIRLHSFSPEDEVMSNFVSEKEKNILPDTLKIMIGKDKNDDKIHINNNVVKNSSVEDKLNKNSENSNKSLNSIPENINLDFDQTNLKPTSTISTTEAILSNSLLHEQKKVEVTTNAMPHSEIESLPSTTTLHQISTTAAPQESLPATSQYPVLSLQTNITTPSTPEFAQLTSTSTTLEDELNTSTPIKHSLDSIKNLEPSVFTEIDIIKPFEIGFMISPLDDQSRFSFAQQGIKKPFASIETPRFKTVRHKMLNVGDPFGI